MALGADRGICITTTDTLEPLNVAKVLQKVVEQEQPGLIILGKQSIDSDNNQVGQMLAALCGLPQGTFAYKLTVSEGRVQVGREVDGGEQQVSLLLPAVVTTDLRLNEPRYAKLPDIMKAKKKPVDIIPLADMGLDLRPRTQILSIAEPAGRSGCKMLNSSAELVETLRNVKKVIP
jgi:electron transfer flavoprotein beta subunit